MARHIFCSRDDKNIERPVSIHGLIQDSTVPLTDAEALRLIRGLIFAADLRISDLEALVKIGT